MNLPYSAVKDEDLIFQADIFNYMEEATTVGLNEMTKVLVLWKGLEDKAISLASVCSYVCSFLIEHYSRVAVRYMLYCRLFALLNTTSFNEPISF